MVNSAIYVGLVLGFGIQCPNPGSRPTDCGAGTGPGPRARAPEPGSEPKSNALGPSPGPAPILKRRPWVWALDPQNPNYPNALDPGPGPAPICWAIFCFGMQCPDPGLRPTNWCAGTGPGPRAFPICWVPSPPWQKQ